MADLGSDEIKTHPITARMRAWRGWLASVIRDRHLNGDWIIVVVSTMIPIMGAAVAVLVLEMVLPQPLWWIGDAVRTVVLSAGAAWLLFSIAVALPQARRWACRYAGWVLPQPGE